MRNSPRAAQVRRRTQCLRVCVATIGLLLVSLWASAQVFPLQVQVSVRPPYSAYLQDYAGAGQQVQIFIINTSRQTYQIRLAGQLTGDNGVEIRTSPNYRPLRPLTVPPGQRLLTRSDLEGLFDLNQIEVAGMDRNLLARGLPLPEGNYQLCVRALNETSSNTAGVAFSQPLSAEFPLGCSAPIIVKAVEPPILISPRCDDQVTPLTPQATIFTWAPPAGISPAQVDYTLRIVELPQLDVDPNVYIDAIVLPISGVEVRNLRTSTFLYGPTQPPLIVGKRYAWRVQAIDRTGKLNMLNDGKSPVCAFTYGATDLLSDKKPVNVVYKSGEIGTTCSCKVPIADKTVNNKPALEAGKATVAGFPLTFLKTADGVKEVDGVLTGHGTIPMPIVNNANFKLRVELINVQCNAAGEVVSGYVQALRSGDFPSIFPKVSKPALEPPGMPELSTANADSVGSQVKKLSDQIKGMPNHLLSSAKDMAASIGMEVPFGIDKTIGPINTVLSITDVIYTPENAYLNANTFIKAPGVGGAQFDGIPLAAYHLCIQPDGTCGDKVLYLAADMPASSLLTLKGGMVAFKALQAKVTHVVFDGDGFNSLHIAAGLKPPGLHRADNGSDLELLLTTDLNTPDFNDWQADITFDDFYVGSLKDYVFSMTDDNGNVSKGTYDHSDSGHPDGFLSDYADLGETWQGVYFPLLQVKLSGPFAKLNKQGKPLTGGVKNMLHDAQSGFSGKLFLQNILTLGDGQMKSWGISIDELSGTFKNSDFKEASMVGRVGLPLFKKDDGTASTLSYSAAIANNPGSTDFTFNVKPVDNMHVDVWRADLQLNTDSHINLAYVAGSFSAKALLNGKLDLDLSITKITAAKFEELGLMTEAPYFSMKNVSFNSPQRYIGGVADDGFPLTLTSFSVVSPAGVITKSPAIARDLAFTGNVNLTESASFSASATARVRFTVGPTWESWGYNDYFIDSLSAYGKIGPATIAATIGFMHDEPTWGNGFTGRATLDVGLAGAVQVKAMFGRTLGDAGYRYYYVSGAVPLGPTGIPLGSTGLGLKAFRGGLYRHVAQTVNGTNVSFTPNSTVDFGIQAGVIIGTVGTNLLNMDGTLTFQFGNDPKVIIDAGAYVMHNGAPPVYENPLATGRGLLTVDIGNGIISGSFSLTAKQGLNEGFSVQAVSNAELYLEPKNMNFYLAFGNPNGQRTDLSLMLSGKEIIGLDSYFLMGTYVPESVFGSLPPPMSTDIVSPDLISRLNYKPNPFKGQGAALAFGAGFHLGTPANQNKVNFGPFYFSFYLGAGYDFVLKQVEACKGYNPPGFNGWYAVGQVYAGLGFSLGVEVDLWFFDGKVEVAGGDAAALLQGGMVNPVWLQGSVAIRYRALRGLVKGTCSAHIEYNTDKICIPDPPPVNPFGQPIIASLQPNGAKDQNVISPFYAEFNYPIETNIDVDSVDNNGNYLATLTFRVVYIPGEQFTATPIAFGGNAAQYAPCIGDNSGRLRYGVNEEGEVNTAATFYRNAAMAPQADYELKLGLVATRREKDGKFHPFYFKGKLIDTTAVAKFHTGKCNTTMTREGNNKTVAYSYPFEGQRYFMKGEADMGFVEFLAKSCCVEGLSNTEEFSLKVRITPGFDGMFNDKKAFLVDATYDGLHVQYKMPIGLANSQLYKMEVVRIPSQAYIEKQEAVLAELKKMAKQQAATGNWTVGIAKGVDPGVSIGNKNDFGNQTYPSGMGAGPKPGTGTSAGSAGGTSASNGGGGTSVYYASAGNVSSPGAGLGIGAQGVNNKADQLVSNYVALIDDGGLVLYDQNKAKKSDKMVKTSKAALDYEVGKQLEQVLYSYYFQTSKYNTLADKLKDVFLNPFAQKTTTSIVIIPLPEAIFTLPMSNSGENFDQYELQVADLGYAKYLPPLVNFRANTTMNAWFIDYMKPTLRLMYPASYALDFAKKKQQKQSGGFLGGVVDQVSEGVSDVFGSSPSIDNSVAKDIDLLERQMASVNAAFDLPEKPISAQEVDHALLASESYYDTDQITGKDVLVSAGTKASISKNGNGRYGISLTALPFWSLYQQRLVPFADQYLAINRENFKLNNFSLYASLLGVIGPLCENYNMSKQWQTNVYTKLNEFVKALDLTLPAPQVQQPLSTAISNAIQYADGMYWSYPESQTNLPNSAQDYQNAVNGTSGGVKKSVFAPGGLTVEATVKGYFAYLALFQANSDVFWNDATSKALVAARDGKYSPLSNRHGTQAQIDTWSLSPLKLATMSLKEPAGVSDSLWDKLNNCPSNYGFTKMVKSNKTGLILIK